MQSQQLCRLSNTLINKAKYSPQGAFTNVTVNSINAGEMLIDTGSTDTTLRTDIAKKLGLSKIGHVNHNSGFFKYVSNIYGYLPIENKKKITISFFKKNYFLEEIGDTPIKELHKIGMDILVYLYIGLARLY